MVFLRTLGTPYTSSPLKPPFFSSTYSRIASLLKTRDDPFSSPFSYCSSFPDILPPLPRRKFPFPRQRTAGRHPSNPCVAGMFSPSFSSSPRKDRPASSSHKESGPSSPTVAQWFFLPRRFFGESRSLRSVFFLFFPDVGDDLFLSSFDSFWKGRYSPPLQSPFLRRRQRLPPFPTAISSHFFFSSAPVGFLFPLSFLEIFFLPPSEQLF